jgi:hypothetical protein
MSRNLSLTQSAQSVRLVLTANHQHIPVPRRHSLKKHHFRPEIRPPGAQNPVAIGPRVGFALHKDRGVKAAESNSWRFFL